MTAVFWAVQGLRFFVTKKCDFGYTIRSPSTEINRQADERHQVIARKYKTAHFEVHEMN